MWENTQPKATEGSVQQGFHCWLSKPNENLVIILGCCGIFPTENLPEKTVELVKFYLTREARGKGIGKLLMEKCLEKAKEIGYNQVYLESLPAFSKAVSIYEKQGFQYLEKALGDSGHSGCNLWMIKKLQ